MSTPFCTQCQQEFPGQDYCPVHGVRLLVGATPERMSEPAAAQAKEEQPQAGTASEPAPSSAEKLANFMKKFRLREVDQAQTGHGEEDSGLPEELRELGWQIAGAVASQAGVDRWPVARQVADRAEQAIFSLYRLGSLTSDVCYQHIESVSAPSLPAVLAYGTLDLTGGARADYDLTVPQTRDGKPLDIWFAETQAGEERARFLLAPLAALLQIQQQGGIQAIVLEPSHLELTEDSCLVMSVVGALAKVEQYSKVVRYQPEFARSSLLPQNWTAPEVMQQSVLSTKSPLFSAGQLLAQAIFGQAFTLAEIQAGAIPFRAIEDHRLSRILMGCLYPSAAERWSFTDFLAATTCGLEELPAVGPWDSLVPGAASTAFSFAGRSFWRLEDLLGTAVLPPHWDEAVTRIHDLLDWAKSTNWVGQAELLHKTLAAGRTPDYALMQLAYTVRPDAPRTWRGLDLSNERAQESLGALAQRALLRDPSAIATMHAFFAADLREALIE